MTIARPPEPLETGRRRTALAQTEQILRARPVLRRDALVAPVVVLPPVSWCQWKSKGGKGALRVRTSN
jgi:hypothetical protein